MPEVVAVRAIVCGCCVWAVVGCNGRGGRGERDVVVVVVVGVGVGV